MLLTSCQSTQVWHSENSGQVFHDTLASGIKGPTMVWVPAGRFLMGSDGPGVGEDEGPAHWLTMEQAFAVGQFEITVAQYRQFVQHTGYRTLAETYKGCRAYNGTWFFKADASWRNPYFEQQEDHPVVCLTYRDAIAYTRWLSRETQSHYRLPTEAEWEYFNRGGTSSRYWWGEESHCENANCNPINTIRWVEHQTEAVGSYPPNPFGLFDTAGNSWEWTASPYTEVYDGSEIKPFHYSQPVDLVIRGGSWYSGVFMLRSSKRVVLSSEEPWSTVGFRVVKMPGAYK